MRVKKETGDDLRSFSHGHLWGVVCQPIMFYWGRNRNVGYDSRRVCIT